MMRDRAAAVTPEDLKMLGNQLAQSGELPANASEEDKSKAAQAYIGNQVEQFEQQFQQRQLQRNLVVNQRFGGTLSAVILAVAFVLLALAAVI